MIFHHLPDFEEAQVESISIKLSEEEIFIVNQVSYVHMIRAVLPRGNSGIAQDYFLEESLELDFSSRKS